MLFRNRADAGRKLAIRVDQYLFGLSKEARQADVIVVGLPRGGVPVALEVARRFCCPLEIIVAKKLPYPNQPEYAIGAVCPGGVVVLSPDIPETKSWKDYIEAQKRELISSTQRREDEYYMLAGKFRGSFEEKLVIIVDDGVATGMTALAAIELAKQRGAAKVILAAPVMSKESYKELRSHCDGVVTVYVPEVFNAVGEHYAEFLPTSNEEVVKAMIEANQFHNCPSPGRSEMQRKTVS